MTEIEYIKQLFTDWCECAPYGEQVPDEWPKLMAAFVKSHAGKDADQMADLLVEADATDPFERLLESIFILSCGFVLRDLSNAVHGRDSEKLKLIGIADPPKREKTKTAEPSERGKAFAKWFHQQLPAGVNPSVGWEQSWAHSFDEMIRLDGRTPEQIAAVCQAAFAHPFWSGQFLSPLKLRKRDKAKVMYFDIFAKLSNGPRSQAAVKAGRHYAEPSRELPEG